MNTINDILCTICCKISEYFQIKSLSVLIIFYYQISTNYYASINIHELVTSTYGCVEFWGFEYIFINS